MILLVLFHTFCGGQEGILGPETEAEVLRLYNLGSMCLADKNYECSITHYEQVLTMDPSFYQAWQNLALAYDHTAQHLRAHPCHEKVNLTLTLTRTLTLTNPTRLSSLAQTVFSEAVCWSISPCRS